MVKTNTKVLCKDTIKNITNDWTGGYYLTLKRNYTVTRYRMLIAIGYKYNKKNDLSFVTTDDAGSTKYVITYLSK